MATASTRRGNVLEHHARLQITIPTEAAPQSPPNRQRRDHSTTHNKPNKETQMKHGIIIACLIRPDSRRWRARRGRNQMPRRQRSRGRRASHDGEHIPTAAPESTCPDGRSENKYDDLNESFKKEAAKLRASSSPNGGATNSPAGGAPPDARGPSVPCTGVTSIRCARFSPTIKRPSSTMRFQHGPGRGGHGDQARERMRPPPPAPSDK